MPPYRLQTLLEMRERAEEAAKQAFSEASRAAHAAETELQRLEDDLKRRRAERKAKVAAYVDELVKKGAVPNSFTMIHRYEQRLKDEEAQVELDIERQKEVVKEARELLEQRRLEMAEAAKEKKAIEKHKENWAKAVRAERQMREDLVQEEIGNVLHLQRNRKS